MKSLRFKRNIRLDTVEGINGRNPIRTDYFGVEGKTIRVFNIFGPTGDSENIDIELSEGVFAYNVSLEDVVVVKEELTEEKFDKAIKEFDLFCSTDAELSLINYLKANKDDVLEAYSTED